MTERHNSNRTPYKFDDEVKHEARERAGGKCEWCGKEVPKLEAHHLVAIWFAREIPCLAPIVIKSLANLIYLCPSCHEKHHSTPETPEKYLPYVPIVVQKYLEMQVEHKQPTPPERQYANRNNRKKNYR